MITAANFLSYDIEAMEFALIKLTSGNFIDILIC